MFNIRHKLNTKRSVLLLEVFLSYVGQGWLKLCALVATANKIAHKIESCLWKLIVRIRKCLATYRFYLDWERLVKVLHG